MTHKNTLRVYGRAELARLYYGSTASDNTALRWLMTEIKNFPGLYEKLLQKGFKKSGKRFPAPKLVRFSTLWDAPNRDKSCRIVQNRAESCNTRIFVKNILYFCSGFHKQPD